MPCLANFPVVDRLSYIREGTHGDLCHGFEQVFENPRQPGTGELDRGLRVDFEKFDLKTWCRCTGRRLIRDQEVNAVQLECVGYGLYVT